MKKTVSYGKFFNYLCADLMLLLLVTQFLPFWPCADCKDCATGVASISDYVWFPGHHDGVGAYLTETFGEFDLNSMVLTPVLILVSSVLTIVFCTLKARKPLYAIIPFIGGISGIVGYMKTPSLQTNSIWTLSLILSVLVLVCSLVTLTQPIVNLVLRKKGVLIKETKVKKNDKYISNSTAWSAIIGTVTICIAITMLVIMPIL